MSTATLTMTTTPVCPPAPTTLAEAGLSHELVMQLLKHQKDMIVNLVIHLLNYFARRLLKFWKML